MAVLKRCASTSCQSRLYRPAKPSLFDHIATREEVESRTSELIGWIAGGTLRLRIEFEYPPGRAADAQCALEGRHTAGKVLLIP